MDVPARHLSRRHSSFPMMEWGPRWFGEPQGILQVEGEADNMPNRKVAGQFHQQLHRVGIVVFQQELPHRHEKRDDELVCKRGWAGVGKEGVPKLKSVRQVELASE